MDKLAGLFLDAIEIVKKTAHQDHGEGGPLDIQLFDESRAILDKPEVGVWQVSGVVSLMLGKFCLFRVVLPEAGSVEDPISQWRDAAGCLSKAGCKLGAMTGTRSAQRANFARWRSASMGPLVTADQRHKPGLPVDIGFELTGKGRRRGR